MAVASGIPPDTLGRLTLRDFYALDGAVAERWTTVEELLAQQVEMLHWLCCIQIARGGRKPPKPYRINRPGEKTEKPALVGPAAFAALTQPKVA